MMLVRVLIDFFDTARLNEDERRLNTMNFVAFFEKQSSQICSILPCAPVNQCFLAMRIKPLFKCKQSDRLVLYKTDAKERA